MNRHKHPSNFFTRLSYSFGNEDWQAERQALRIQPKDRVLCITASGDRPLHLLLDECAELISVDLNTQQNHLLELKVRAMETFDTERYVSFLGGKPDPKRLEKFISMQQTLDNTTREFWQGHSSLIKRGVLYQGAMERFCRKAAIAFKIMRGRKINTLFSFSDIAEQRHFVASKWDTAPWRTAFRSVLNSPLLRRLFHDPGFDHVGESISPGDYIYHRLHSTLGRVLARDNPFLSLILRGYVEPSAFPPYLTTAGVEVIRSRLDRLSWHHANVIDFLEKAAPNSIDCFSLSDIASYMDSSNFLRLLAAVRGAARPGARFSIRQFMSERRIPDALRESFLRDYNLERHLEEQDYCFVYRFMAGTISK